MSNSFTLSSKTIHNLEMFHTAVKAAVPEFEGFLVDDECVTVLLNTTPDSTLIDLVEAVTPPTIPQTEQVKQILENARAFGATIIVDFAISNILMGITQSGKTGPVSDYLHRLTHYLDTGSLYEAMNRIDFHLADVSPEKAELAPFVTNERLLDYKQQIQDYLTP